MPETVAVDQPLANVSASALAQHLDCSRTFIGKREADGVIERQGDGFPLDQSRVAYIQHLRRERRQSPRSNADADHVKLKTEMLQLRLTEKRRELVRRADVDALIEGIAGATLTALSSLPGAVSAARRSCDPSQHRAGHVRGCVPRSLASVRRWPTSAASRHSMNSTDDAGADLSSSPPQAHVEGVNEA
ncbi:hypothetical protein JEY40_31655 [Bradyrhizobium japonicum]|uniref:hypothetical protein n=1 Tax=Bradyrhizobium japonicum TaxID=375 RepID=UPI0012BD6481|nr:hypothetical protein [Bradyrhizobium japonicum]MCS3894317.1 hypothetical protein [Bradyrhizobium japonicum USDA 38]MCS3946831.1 hypothetical protein [Bradyrhizobium japonicum]MCW2220394.1 hypothetical protein [Bradyrhizobium japonicum]MCW2345008.1 hypothetical protein [Bradyrhizobium japonicum]UQD70480.1 hypothetical protein JEY40_31655 [Bradyrhizobium japonicum]